MSEKRKTHWKETFNPDFIGAYAFQPGEEKTLTISRMTIDMVMGTDGREDECTILHWAEKVKPMVLNATNAKIISKLLGSPYIDDWIGKKVVLGVETVKAFGDLVEAVRVQDKQVTVPPTLKERIDFICQKHRVGIETFGKALEELQRAGKVPDKKTAEMSDDELKAMLESVDQAIVEKKKENEK